MPDIRIREIDTTNGLEYAENDFIVFAPIQVIPGSTLKEKLYDNAENFKKDYEDVVVTTAHLTGKDFDTNKLINATSTTPSYTKQDWLDNKYAILSVDTDSHLYLDGYVETLNKIVRTQNPETGVYSYGPETDASYWVTETEPAAIANKVVWKHEVETVTKYTRYIDAYESSTAFNYIYRLLALGMVFYIVPFENIVDLTYEKFFKQYTDLGKYNFGFITLAGLAGTEIAQAAIKCAAVRGDTTALVDVPDAQVEVSDIIDFMQGLTVEPIIRGNVEDSDFYTQESAYKYAFLFAPNITIENNLDLNYPASFDYLACFAKSITKFPAYFAIAGRERGKSPFENVQPIALYGDLDVNQLQVRKPRSGEEKNGSRCCNVIYNCRPFGFVMWGDRTLEPVKLDGLKASHFANIRILCNILKKALYRAAKKYTFEPNSDVLWANFTNELIPLLDEMRSSQGIRGYKFIKETTNEKAKLKARVKIIPIEAVEDFDLTVELTDSIEVTE